MHVYPGDIVGAKRWPYSHAHPDAWGTPYVGEVLAQDDPHAWHQTLAFPLDTLPAQDAVTAHVDWCHAQGLLDTRVPVLWDFGTHGKRVWWEEAASLVPATVDHARWIAAREQAYATYPASKAIQYAH